MDFNFIGTVWSLLPPVVAIALALKTKDVYSSLFIGIVLGAILYSMSMGTGTSWGTFSILIPICIAVFPAAAPLRIISISACMAGAICGDHVSPISDTTIMASAGAECKHVHHVSSQLPYALTVALVSFLTFVVAGFTQQLGIAACAAISWIAWLAMIGSALWLLRRLDTKKVCVNKLNADFFYPY
jgi:Na+/H+ antiporter NhaC